MIEMTRFVQLSIICWLTVIVCASNIGNDRQDINLSNDGGYTDILIAISERVPENPDIITTLQKYFREASKVLLKATRNRMYFRNVTVVIPEEWENNPSWFQPEKDEIYERARVVVAEPNLAYGNVPYTLQPGGCGEEGDYIHFTPEYLTLNMTGGLPYTPAKRIVREFSHLRWGLFDETVPVSDKESPRFYRQDEQLKAVGCGVNVWYRVNRGAACDLETDVFNPSCNFTITDIGGTASLLSFDYWDTVTEFCTTEPDGKTTHNKLAGNLQNKNCDELGAWEIMNFSPDFAKDSKIWDESTSPPDTEFRMVQQRKPVHATTTVSTTSDMTVTVSQVLSTTSRPQTSSATSLQCQQDIVCLCLDVSGSMTTNNRIRIMSESVKIYISTYLRNNTAVGIVAFSDEAYLHANMTEITNSGVRSFLTLQVPDKTVGSTDIGAGLLKCQSILQSYAGNNIDKTRIVLLSDGAGDIGSSISDINEDGITLDTILYDQGGFLTDKADATGGKEFFASDKEGEVSLLQFFAETASKGCTAKNSGAVLKNDRITIPAGERFHVGRVDFDVTTGSNTKIVFKYNVEVNVSITTPQNLPVNIKRDATLQIIVATIESSVEGYVRYYITKTADLNVDANVTIIVTSLPRPEVEPIVIKNRVNKDVIDFSKKTQLVGYLGIYQGLTPVLQLRVIIRMEQPGGVDNLIEYLDDGTGKDSVPNDGIYTGFVPAHKIGGSNGKKYYGLTVEISGEGILPDQDIAGGRRKRCTNCKSLGNVIRSTSGGLVTINNWSQVEDTTPPEKITDLRVVNATKGKVFTLSWTAPGDDLNDGTVQGYEFVVGSNSSIESLVNLTNQAIISNISELLMEAGTTLEIHINASEITAEMLGLEKSANVSTYYIRMRTYDAKHNFANWSNPASASYVDPVYIATLFATSPSPSPTNAITKTTTGLSSTTTNALTTTGDDNTPVTVSPFLPTIPAVSIILAAVGSVVFVAAVGLILICRCQPKKIDSTRSDEMGVGGNTLNRESVANDYVVPEAYGEVDGYAYYKPTLPTRYATRAYPAYYNNPMYME